MAAFSAVNLTKLNADSLIGNKKINIVKTASVYEQEKLIRPFGFKGGYLTELWQTASNISSASGITKTGIATQSVLYGDADLFSLHSEARGNLMMHALTKKALDLVTQTSFYTPIDLLDKILPEIIIEGKRITGKSDLNINFVYNALVSIHKAAW